LLARSRPLVTNPCANLCRLHVGWNSGQLLLASRSSSRKTVSQGWRSILPFDQMVAVICRDSLIRWLDRPWRYCGCTVQQFEHVLD